MAAERTLEMGDGLPERVEENLTPGEQAADWLLRLRAQADDPALQSAHAAWLARSPEHREAWENTCRVWGVLGQTEPRLRAVWDTAPPIAQAIRPRMSTSASPWLPIAALSLSLCLVLPFLPQFLLGLSADHASAVGETRIIRLPDGSRATLGGESAIALDFSGKHRSVKLLSGEAFFEVTPDAAKPFVVEAGGAAVEVLGTVFDVRLGENETDIALAEGSVKASVGGGPARILRPGEMLSLDHANGSWTQVNVDIAEIGAWRDKRLYVAGATVRSVVDRIERYHRGFVVIPEAALAEQRVTGVYDLSDPDRALRALVAPFGGVVRNATPLLRIITTL